MNSRVHDIMEKRRKILLYGDTLLLAGLRASLISYSGLEVADVTAAIASEDELSLLQPDVIIFDAGAVQSTILHEFAEQLPDLLVVGIDSSHNRGFVWSRQQLQELSTSNLVEVIEQLLRGK